MGQDEIRSGLARLSAGFRRLKGIGATGEGGAQEIAAGLPRCQLNSTAPLLALSLVGARLGSGQEFYRLIPNLPTPYGQALGGLFLAELLRSV